MSAELLQDLEILIRARAAQLFEQRLFEEEQRHKRYARRLDAAATRALRCMDAREDFSEVLATLSDATEAVAAVIVAQSVTEHRVLDAHGISARLAEALTDHAPTVELGDLQGTGARTVDSAIYSADRALEEVGLRSLLVTRLPVFEPRRFGILLARHEDAPSFGSRDVHRIEPLAERFAWHLERARLKAELRSATSAALRTKSGEHELLVVSGQPAHETRRRA